MSPTYSNNLFSFRELSIPIAGTCPRPGLKTAAGIMEKQVISFKWGFEAV